MESARSEIATEPTKTDQQRRRHRQLLNRIQRCSNGNRCGKICICVHSLGYHVIWRYGYGVITSALRTIHTHRRRFMTLVYCNIDKKKKKKKTKKKHARRKRPRKVTNNSNNNKKKWIILRVSIMAYTMCEEYHVYFFWCIVKGVRKHQAHSRPVSIS